jgi:biopolymer transport protein ExbB
MRKRIVIAWFTWSVCLCGMVWAQETAQKAAQMAEAGSLSAGEAQAVHGLTVFELLLKGGPLMYPLYLCSIVMVAFGIERAISLRREKILPAAAVARLRELTSESAGNLDAQALRREFQAASSPIFRIVSAGLRKADRPIPELEKAIEDAGAKEADRMRRNSRVLSIVASLSPLLGLLGTVTGMIRAFMTVAASEEALGRTELLAGGIYEALVTTAVGLTIAIPAMVLFYIYEEKVDRMVMEMDDIATDVVEKMSATTVK